MAKFLLSAFADEAASDIDGQIAALKNNSIRFIELRNIDGNPIIDHDVKAIQEVADKLRDGGIGISAIGSYIGKISINDDFAPHVEAFKRTLEAAHILGTKRIRLFSFFIPKNEVAENYRNEVFDRLDRLLSLSEAAGVDCFHENEKEIYGDIKSRCVDLLQSFGGRLKGIFDPANFIQCGESPIRIFDDLFQYTDYLHIKDANIADGSVVPSGHGDGDIRGILDRFVNKDGDRFLTVEPHLTVFEGFANLRDHSLKCPFTYADSETAFSAAVTALKDILNERSYPYE